MSNFDDYLRELMEQECVRQKEWEEAMRMLLENTTFSVEGQIVYNTRISVWKEAP